MSVKLSAWKTFAVAVVYIFTEFLSAFLVCSCYVLLCLGHLQNKWYIMLLLFLRIIHAGLEQCSECFCTALLLSSTTMRCGQRSSANFICQCLWNYGTMALYKCIIIIYMMMMMMMMMIIIIIIVKCCYIQHGEQRWCACSQHCGWIIYTQNWIVVN